MAFNIIESSRTISNKYKRYLKTMFDIKDTEYKTILKNRLEENSSFEKGPYLDVTNSFEKGKSVKDLIEEGVLSADFSKIDRLYNIPNLHFHQEQALRKSLQGENLIVSTGTGSGKTECFLIPLINELMREKEAGKLCDGVRALIIYPMNALANDQIDRLRKLFINYPAISFGCYTGQTRYHEETKGKDKGAVDQYIELNGKRMDDVRLQKPLKNERLSRDSMKAKPPHILITNYAMLEYLMLRPEDNVFFDGEKAKYWKYIILDEAHTYTGSTGIEVSMLLRRLSAKLSVPKIQFILTSATLGDEKSNKDVVSFAERLCSSHFSEESIIRAKRVNLKNEVINYSLKPSFYGFVNELIEHGYSDDYIISAIENQNKFGLKSQDLNEYLFDLLIEDSTFWTVKKFLAKTKSIKEICDYTGWSEKELSDFVDVASKANKNQSKLFDSRYHMFLRATEGVFITLAPHKDLFLTRKNYVSYGKDEYKVFEAVTCTQCHALYLIGQIDEKGYLIQKNNYGANEIKEAFYLGDQVNDTDEDDTLENSELKVEEYELCPHCGFTRSVNTVHKTSCGHDESHFVKIIKVKTTNIKTGRVTKCIACENVNRLGILRGFFTGQEASTSVIGTALFEELPSHIKKVTIRQEEEDGFDVEIGESVDEVAKAKQFIAFSDSRQAAAYFASYFSMSYDGFLYGKLIKDVLNQSTMEEIEVKTFIQNMSQVIKENNIIPFDDYLHCLKTQSVKSYDYEKVAWKALLKEFVECNSRNSLYGLGLLSLDFNNQLNFGPHKKYSLTKEDVKNICMVFVLWMLTDAAMYYPKNLNDMDKEYFTHNGIELTYLKDSGSKYVRAFIPQNDSRMNKRLDYLKRILTKIDPDVQREDAKIVLKQIWDAFFAPESLGKAQIMRRNKDAHYQVNVENLVIKKENKWYRCNKCNKLTAYNVHGICPTYRCDGVLEAVDIDALEQNNHYYRMYNDLLIEPLRVVEHTAQLDREEAYNYQNLFKDQKIDVLSCSTTFEMGVDVGDLETVFMRNMPPSASNYAQRAGRAGRSSTAAAFALTFCNKSNHDFNYFENPTDMISGIILPPQFKTDNEKICIRHLYSSALSFFFRNYPDYFTNARDMMDKSEKTGLSGYDVFEIFLKTESKQREELKKFLINAVPKELQKKFKVESFGWVCWLFEKKHEEYPNLKTVRDVYLDEIGNLKKEYQKAKDQGSGEQFSFKYRIRNYEDEPIISFLSKNNILPKYGFPVDTVNLEVNVKSGEDELEGLELSRDLSMAISEYAPGCQVVANNRLITSRYIKKMSGFDWKKYDYVQCEDCKTLNVILHQFLKPEEKHPLCKCKGCSTEQNKNKIKTFLIPEFGFVAEEKVAKPSLVKPEKTFRTEASFFNYKECQEESSYHIGGSVVDVAVVGNDGEMAMLNTTDFFVCPNCGYTIETPEGVNPFVKNITEKNKHKKPDGYPCKNLNLEKYSLGYKFKSDVVRIRIRQPLLTIDTLYEEAYSILQAIILATCKELNIDHTEISGCLEYYFDNGINYSYILYDNTPGGAGHVKRLNDKDVIHHVLINAMNLSQKCPNCDEDSSCYSCLRTYQNQKHHDIIKRRYVYNYLGLLLNGYNEEGTDSPLEDTLLNRLHGASSIWEESGVDNKRVYKAMFANCEWLIEPQVYLDPKQNVFAPSKPDYVMIPLNTDNRKIAIFTDGFTFHNNEIDRDSQKRDAILFSDNYRVWSLSYKDLNNSGESYSAPVFNGLLPEGEEIIPNDNNSYELLLEYISSEDSELKFNSLADKLFTSYLKKAEEKDIRYELGQLRDEVALWDEAKIKKMAKYRLKKDSQLVMYFVDAEEKVTIIYLQDYIDKRGIQFQSEWNAFLQLFNIMQFGQKFIAITQKGLDEDLYSVLDRLSENVINKDDLWNQISFQFVDDETKNFVNECIINKIPVPSVVGYETDEGYMAEMEWDDIKAVYLTSEQKEFKNIFLENGFTIVSSYKDIEALIDK